MTGFVHSAASAVLQRLQTEAGYAAVFINHKIVDNTCGSDGNVIDFSHFQGTGSGGGIQLAIVVSSDIVKCGGAVPVVVWYKIKWSCM